MRRYCARAPILWRVTPEQSAFQELYGFFVNAFVATGEDGFAVAAICTVPGRDDTACTFHQGNQRRDVPAVEASFNDDVDKTQRQRREQIAVAAIARHTRGRAHPREGCLLVGRE